MPIYEYECKKCGHIFTREQSIKDSPLKRCPECKGKVERLISAGVNFIFKGSGFYTTDYRSSEYKEKARKDTEKAGSGSEKKKPSGEKSAGKKKEKVAKKKDAASGASKKKK